MVLMRNGCLKVTNSRCERMLICACLSEARRGNPEASPSMRLAGPNSHRFLISHEGVSSGLEVVLGLPRFGARYYIGPGVR